MLKLVRIAAVLSARPLSSSIALAAANEYWIVQDPSTQKCSIVETEQAKAKAPPNTALTTPFKSRAEAQASMQRMRKCGLAD